MNALLVVLCFVFVFSQHALSKWILNSIMATATDLLFLTLCRVPPHQEKIKFPDISLTTKQFQWAWLWQPLTRDYSFHWSAFTVHIVANLKQSENGISWLFPDLSRNLNFADLIQNPLTFLWPWKRKHMFFPHCENPVYESRQESQLMWWLSPWVKRWK